MSGWLGLDGALGAFSAALVRTGAEPRVGSTSGQDALERGLVVVDEVLGAVALASLDGIAVGIGPGSFTGLRIAVGYAKSLAFAAGLPLAGVSSYDALEEPDAPAPRLTFVHGRAGVACARYRPADGGDALVVCGDYAAVAERLAARLGPGALTMTAGAPAGAVSALGERGITVQLSRVPLAVPALAIARRASAGLARAGSPHVLRADYGEHAYFERPGATPAT